MSPPVCPGCGNEVASITYGKAFVFDSKGYRHDAGWSWQLHCCGKFIYDVDVEFRNVDEHSSLIDHAGNVVLSWLDKHPEDASDG